MLPCFTQDILPSCHSNTPPSHPVPHPRHLHLSHTTHIHTRTRAQPRHPSPHHPQTSPLSLFQGAHGKPPESAGLRRTWAWPNSFPWLWTWDHPLLIFLSYPFLFVAFALFSSFHRSQLTIVSSFCPYLPLSPSWAPLLTLFLYLLICAPGTGIWKSFGFFLKGLIHTRHILLDADRCTMAWWRSSKMTTIMLWSRLIRRRNKLNASPVWVSVARGWWWRRKGL